MTSLRQGSAQNQHWFKDPFLRENTEFTEEIKPDDSVLCLL